MSRTPLGRFADLVRLVMQRSAAYWLDPVPQRSLPLCRIVFGAVLFLAYVNVLPVFPMLYGKHGIGGATFHEHVASGPGIARGVFVHFAWLGNAGEWTLRVLFALLLLSALSFALGFFTGWSGAALVVLHLLFLGRSDYAFWGWAAILVPFVAYVTASPASRRCSLDAGLRGVRAESVAPAFPLRLLQLHCVCLYLTIFTSRLDTPYWMDGTGIYRILSDRTFSRLPDAWLELKLPLKVLGSSALALEGCAVLLLWRRVSRYVALGLVGMHTGLESLALVGWWNAVLIPVLLTFVVDSGAARRLSPGRPQQESARGGFRAVGAVGLSAYVVLLFLGSLRYVPWPKSRMTALIDDLAHESSRLLARAAVIPGVALFFDPTDTPAFRRGNCLTIETIGANGESQIERIPAAHCARDATPLEVPKDATVLIQLLYDTLGEHPRRYTRKLPTQGPKKVAAIADYFCHGRERAFAPHRLKMKWEQDMRDIQTDREIRKTVMDATWDCTRHEFPAMTWDVVLYVPEEEPIAAH